MRMRNIQSILLIISFLPLSFCAVITKEKAKISEDKKAEFMQVMNLISDKKLLGYVKKLSSEYYAGRLTGPSEYKKCARWVASHFKEWGIIPAGDNQTYLQSYPNPYTIVFEGGELSYNYGPRNARKKRKYAYEKEYYPGSQSGDGNITAEVVYVGYGIMAPEMNYDDYAGVNVKGKIVLVEPEVPVSPKDDPEAFKEWRPYSFHQYKVKMAVAHGAKGMLYNYLTVNPNIEYIKGFIVTQVGEAVVKDIFARTGKTHAEVKEKIKSTLQPHSFRTRKIFTIENYTEHHPKGVGYNVLGMIEGSDPVLKDEVIIIGAHLDHVGFCYEIMPGANDNASGVAVMLGIAEVLAKSQIKPRRSLLFIGFGSEEQGLLGSQNYIKHPAFPLKKTVCFINMDMVGCGDKLRALAADNFPEIWKFISRANEETVQKHIETSYFANLGRPKLDAAIFLSKRVPSISFSAFGAPTYPHSTKDTAATITPGIMNDLARILSWSILNMANTSKKFFK